MKLKYIAVTTGMLVSMLVSSCSKESKKKEVINQGNTEPTLEVQDTQIPTVGRDMEEKEINPTEAMKEEPTQVKSQKTVYEGHYFDESIYQYEGAEVDPALTYCDIEISNVTENSFDFTIQRIVYTSEESEVIVPTSTAVFVGDGTKAEYKGDDEELEFSFPDEEDIFPKHITVSGDEELEGKSYMNNTIPGHEAG